MAKKKPMNTSHQRQIRTQQIIMGVIGVLIVLSMVIGMIVNR
jgi:predicted nucleic acid-binding Zn ribbon protein